MSMKQIAVIGFKKLNDFCFWCKGRGLELEKTRQSLNIWIDKKNQERYIGIFNREFDLRGRRFDDYIEVDEVRLDLYNRITPKPTTRFDEITKDIYTFIKWINDNFRNLSPEHMPCPAVDDCFDDCDKCFKKWLQEEVQYDR